MDLLFVILLGAGTVLAIALFLVLSWAIYYDLSRTSIPPGFDHPLKLRGLHCVFIMMFTLGKVLEALGLCRQVAFVRFTLSFRRPRLSPGLSAKDLLFDGVPVRVYQPSVPSVCPRRGFVFFHGGTGMFGSIDLYQDVCSKISKESNAVVVSVGYRLSPEHRYPAQWEDCFSATVHFLRKAALYGVDPCQVIIGGDSIGGSITTVISQQLVGRSDLPKLRAQVLIYAGLQAMDFNLPSYQQNATVPLVFRENVVQFSLQFFLKDPCLKDDVLKGSHVPDELRLRYGKWVNADNIPEKFKRRGYKREPLAPFKPDVYKQLPEILQVSFSSLFAEDSVMQQLPEALIVSCEYDVLRDDSLLYKKRLEDNGVKVRWFHAENGFHGVLNVSDCGVLTFPTGSEILDNIVDFIKHL